MRFQVAGGGEACYFVGMKAIRKLLPSAAALALPVVAALALASCGSSTEPAVDETYPETTSEPEAEAAPESAAPEAEGGETVSVTPAEAAALMESNPDLVVLDIRRPDEFADGHIAGAVNIEYGAEGFEEKLAELDRYQPYVFHCRSGGRSSAALPVFESLGFRNLYHLDSGMIGWEEAELPVEK